MFKMNASQARHTYVPPHIQAEMERYQARMPEALQRQVQGGVYMSDRAAKGMTEYMQKALPAHLHGYIDPYVRQQSVIPHIGGNTNTQPHVMQPAAPAPNLMRREHSLGFGQQYTVPVAAEVQPNTPTSLAFTSQYQPARHAAAGSTGDTYYSNGSQPAQPAATTGAYDFILNSHKHRPFGLFDGASSQSRILVVLAGILGLLVIVWIVASTASGGSTDTAQLITIAQEQAELVRISQPAAQNATSDTTQDLAANVSLSLSSDQQTLLAYMQLHGGQVPSAAVLAKGKNPSSDTTLQAALSNGTYDQTYRDLVAQELNVYAQDLKQTFNQSHSPVEQTMLRNAYRAASLLATESGQTT